MISFPRASIIILVKNGARYLDKILDRVFSQRVPWKFEVIVIDSGSKDKSLEIAAQYPVLLRKIRPEEFNHSATRNWAARIARGEYVVYLTQDAIPADDQWLEKLIEPFDDPHVAGVSSRHIPREDCNPILARRIENRPYGSRRECVKYIFDIGQENFNRNPRKYIYFSNASSCVRREILLKHPFPQTDYAEDAFWELLILQKGFKTIYGAQSAIYHSHGYSLIDNMRECYEVKKAFLRLFGAFQSFGRRKSFMDVSKWIVGLLRKVIDDALYIGQRKDLTISRKLFWIFYIVPWYFSSLAGELLGRMNHILPRFVRAHLSRQELLKRR